MRLSEISVCKTLFQTRLWLVLFRLVVAGLRDVSSLFSLKKLLALILRNELCGWPSLLVILGCLQLRSEMFLQKFYLFITGSSNHYILYYDSNCTNSNQKIETLILIRSQANCKQMIVDHVLYLLDVIIIMKHTTTQLDFAAKPKVTAVKPKYREETRLDGTNLMNDPRVVRGNTYAALVENKNDIQPPPRKPTKEAPRRKQRKINFDTGFEVSTPRAVDGRQHFTVQTEPFVQTLRDKPIQYEKQCQSDLFLDRPVEREFDPMKGMTGVSKSTQIEENDPQLFDFNYEVQPIVDALLSKIVETSRMELYEQQQLEKKQKEKEQYEQRRHARLAEAQKLQANETRLKEEYDRRQLQYRKSNQQQCATQKKVISRILSKQYLKHLKNNTYKILDSQGFFRQPLQTDLYANFAPWLYQQIINQLHTREGYSSASADIVNEAEKDVLKESQQFISAEKQRRAKIEKEREQEQKRKAARKEQKKRQRQEQQRAKEAELNQTHQQVPPTS